MNALSRYGRWLAVIAWLLVPSIAAAQSQMRIVAVVNDDVITEFDLGTRIGLAVLTSGQPPSQELFQRLVRPVLRQLIDERLQMQEATARGAVISPQDLQAELTELAQANRTTLERLLADLTRQGVPPDVLRQQIRARASWQRLLVRRQVATQPVTEEEVDEEIADLRRAVGEPEFLLAEIQLNVDTTDSESTVRDAANGLIQRIQGGESFPGLARRFSDSATAAAGGDLGWTRESQLEGEVVIAVRLLRPGQVTPPIRTTSGFSIIILRETRRVPPLEAGATQVTLRQLVLPATPQTADGVIAAARQIQATARSCDDLAAQGARAGAAAPVDSLRVPLTALAPQLAEQAASAPVGQAFGPFSAGTGVALVMVCERTASGDQALRTEIRQRVQINRLENLGRRYIRDLRQAAFIDVRL
jgi:peptidyl-prolyl cis-trans isomerase SurA